MWARCTRVNFCASRRCSSRLSAKWSMCRDVPVALLPLQRGALRTLRTLLLHNGAGHLALAIELELEERPARVLEAGLCACVERGLRVAARLHPEPVAVAAEGRSEPGRRRVLPDVAVEDGGRERHAGCRCRVLR